ncbi:hypothetical protein, partial [Paraburkholderia ultramafica]|uniref:hypothetical protein n=1 Tax=Paraburkholderia ultramafica TaxID=1544867 RepID=UPI001C2E6AD6
IYPDPLPGNAKCPKEIACAASHRLVQKNLNGPGEALTFGGTGEKEEKSQACQATGECRIA